MRKEETDEMFEKLGYKKEVVEKFGYAGDTLLVFHKGVHAQAIVFSLDNKTAWTCGYDELHKDKGEIWGLSGEELQAMYEKVKELGWVE